MEWYADPRLITCILELGDGPIENIEYDFTNCSCVHDTIRIQGGCGFDGSGDICDENIDNQPPDEMDGIYYPESSNVYVSFKNNTKWIFSNESASSIGVWTVSNNDTVISYNGSQSSIPAGLSINWAMSQGNNSVYRVAVEVIVCNQTRLHQSEGTFAPTSAPTPRPTPDPTPIPTDDPAPMPTLNPTMNSTDPPTRLPTTMPTACNHNDIEIYINETQPLFNNHVFNGFYSQRWPDGTGNRQWIHSGFSSWHVHTSLHFNSTSDHWQLSLMNNDSLKEALEYLYSGNQLPRNEDQSTWIVIQSPELENIDQYVTLSFTKSECNCTFGTLKLLINQSSIDMTGSTDPITIDLNLNYDGVYQLNGQVNGHDAYQRTDSETGYVYDIELDGSYVIKYTPPGQLVQEFVLEASTGSFLPEGYGLWSSTQSSSDTIGITIIKCYKSMSPTQFPTFEPSSQPTEIPTVFPTNNTMQPSVFPSVSTQQPTIYPTTIPTMLNMDRDILDHSQSKDIFEYLTIDLILVAAGAICITTN